MPETGHSPTIYDVARRAKVSANTVSRALNGKPGVAEETRARVLRASEELQYHPHLGARALRTRQEGTIGFIYPARPELVPVSRGYFLYLCGELYRTFGTRGDRICIDLNPYADGVNTDYARSVWQKLCSASLFAGPLPSDDSTMERVHATGMPYLALGRLDSLPECSCATVDYDEATCACVQYLARRGHTRIGLLKAFSGFQPGVERQRGYERGLELLGLTYDPRLVQSVTFDAGSAARGAYRLLNDHTVTAIIDASAQEEAPVIRDAARRSGRVAGKDFDVICWTYTMEHRVMDDAIAHMWLPVREAASDGIERLAAWFRGEQVGPIRVVYSPTLVETKDLPPEIAPELARTHHLFDGSLV